MPRRIAGRRSWFRLGALVASITVVIGSPTPASALPGGTAWVARYGGAQRDFTATALAVSSDGARVFVTGYGSDTVPSGEDMVTVAYDAASGTRLWTGRCRGTNDDRAQAIAVDPNGALVYVTGYSYRLATEFDYVTVAYDALSGSRVWSRRYTGPGAHGDFPKAMAVSPDGTRVFVTGSSYDPAVLYRYGTIAYDAATGATLWGRRYVAGYGTDEAQALGVSPDGTRVYVTGYSGKLGHGNDYATVAYDATSGAKAWAARYNGPGNDSDLADTLAVSGDGTRVFVSGQSVGATTGYDFATVAYDAVSGARLWVSRRSGPGSSTDSVTAIGVSPGGSRLFVTGYMSFSATSDDYQTVAYDAVSGHTLWATRYSGRSSDDPAALGVSGDGTAVYVTGSSYEHGTLSDYLTVGYDAASGTQLWKAVYTNGDRHRQDFGTALGVSPGGDRVYVTGSSYASFRLAYATVAYETT